MSKKFSGITEHNKAAFDAILPRVKENIDELGIAKKTEIPSDAHISTIAGEAITDSMNVITNLNWGPGEYPGTTDVMFPMYILPLTLYDDDSGTTFYFNYEDSLVVDANNRQCGEIRVINGCICLSFDDRDYTDFTFLNLEYIFFNEGQDFQLKTYQLYHPLKPTTFIRGTVDCSGTPVMTIQIGGTCVPNSISVSLASNKGSIFLAFDLTTHSWSITSQLVSWVGVTIDDVVFEDNMVTIYLDISGGDYQAIDTYAKTYGHGEYLIWNEELLRAAGL